MRLIRLDADIFAALERNWRAQCDAYGERFDEFAVQQVGHARQIAGEPTIDERYGILALQNEAVFEALMHLNWARLPGTDGQTLRVVWILLSPEFDFDDVAPARFGGVAAAIINECLRFSEGAKLADHIKVHLGNLADREYFQRTAELLRGMPYFSDARVRGNWFHLSKAS